MASTKLRKFSWTDVLTLEEYWGDMVNFGVGIANLDGSSPDCSRYDHNHATANLVTDPNNVLINQTNKDKLYGLKTQSLMESWVDSEISRLTLIIDWRPAVNYYSDLANVASPQDGWCVPVLQDQGSGGDYRQSGDYRYHNNTQHPTGQATGWYLVNSTKVPNASSTISGLMTSADFNKLSALVSFPGFGTTNGTAAQGNHTHTAGDVGAIPTSASCNKAWNWSGQGGQPPWLWGGVNGQEMYVYNPANFSVNRATYANNCDADLQMNNKWIRGVTDIEFYSDINLKTSLEKINQEMVSDVLGVQAYKYKLKKDLDKTRYGYIAQDIQKLFPDMVSTNKKGFLTLNYREITLLKIEAIILEMANLKAEIAKLKGE